MAERPHGQEPQQSPRERYINIINDLAGGMHQLRIEETAAESRGDLVTSREKFRDRMTKADDLRWLDVFESIGLPPKDTLKIFDEKVEPQKVPVDPTTPKEEFREQVTTANTLAWVNTFDKIGISPETTLGLFHHKDSEEEKHEEHVLFEDIVNKLQEE